MKQIFGMRVIANAHRIKTRCTISTIAVVSLMALTASTWAQVPVFKLWVTEVYEVNPDGSYTPKCGVDCPTQDLAAGIAQVGDLINIEVTVEGWDASTDAGECNVDHEVCSVSAQNCPGFHCSGFHATGECVEDSNCFAPDTCDPDSCEKAPLLGTFQWTIDSSTYSNGGAGPGLAPAELACTSDADCACAYTEIPGNLNDCADFVDLSPSFCSCIQARCGGNACSVEAAAYIDSSPLTNYVFFSHSSVAAIQTISLDYIFAATSLDASIGGVPEELFRCNATPFPICNVDADCSSGTCELVARSPYYLGTLLLEATGESCGLFTLDLVQDLSQGAPAFTFLNDNNAVRLPTPIVEPLTIDLGSAVPCNDGDACTENDVFCAGECAGTPIVCDPGATCVAGVCQSDDCNGNGISDECDINCGPPGGPCDIPGCGQSEDCNGNGVPDECDTPVCGDGCRMGTEECDDAGESATCDVDCTLAECGDGTLNAAAGEACDDAGESAACDVDCTSAECGDGTHNATAGEACDDAGESAACDVDCTLAECGDGILNATAGEACDDGLNNSDTEPDACRTDCNQAGCGDGVVDTGEECDDGNTEPGDDCDENCLFEPGACCLGTACSTATHSDCVSSGGTFFGFTSTCDAPDADGDGLRNECDGCPTDSNKIEPGICGCGVDDSADSDDDGVPDCEDICPGADDAVFGDCTGTIPTVSVWGLLILALLLLAGSKVVFRDHTRRYPFP